MNKITGQLRPLMDIIYENGSFFFSAANML